jgi:antitoxin HigA-1
MKKNGMRPVPPGEILNEEFLKPLDLTANALAKAIGVPANRITAILKDERRITGG